MLCSGVWFFCRHAGSFELSLRTYAKFRLISHRQQITRYKINKKGRIKEFAVFVIVEK